jgi:hypothetical protein
MNSPLPEFGIFMDFGRGGLGGKLSRLGVIVQEYGGTAPSIAKRPMGGGAA